MPDPATEIEGPSSAAMHAHHHIDADSLVLPVVETSAHSHTSGAMVAAHIIAAVVTIAVFHWSEVLLIHLVMLARLVWSVFAPLIFTIRLFPTSRLPRPSDHVDEAPSDTVPLTSILRRGPPALAL